MGALGNCLKSCTRKLEEKHSSTSNCKRKKYCARRKNIFAKQEVKKQNSWTKELPHSPSKAKSVPTI